MNFLLGYSIALGFALAPNVYAVEESQEKIKTTISAVTKDEDRIEVPHQIPNLEWDPKGIRLIRRDVSQQKFSVILKGKLSKHRVESFTYQVDGYNAHPIKLVKNAFEVEVPLEKSPAVIRLWLEVIEGQRAVRIYSDQVHVRSDIVPGAGQDKQINY